MVKIVFAECPKCKLWFSNAKGKEIFGLSRSELQKKQQELERAGLSCMFRRKGDKHCPVCGPSEEARYPYEERRGQQLEDESGRGYQVL